MVNIPIVLFNVMGLPCFTFLAVCGQFAPYLGLKWNAAQISRQTYYRFFNTKDDINCNLKIFLSTHPVRGGTSSRYLASAEVVFQSTHPVRGGTAKVYKRLCITCALSTKMVRNREESTFLNGEFSMDFSLSCHFSGANRPGKWQSLPLRTRP